jgi:hypothetical protein
LPESRDLERGFPTTPAVRPGPTLPQTPLTLAEYPTVHRTHVYGKANTPKKVCVASSSLDFQLRLSLVLIEASLAYSCRPSSTDLAAMAFVTTPAILAVSASTTSFRSICAQRRAHSAVVPPVRPALRQSVTAARVPTCGMDVAHAQVPITLDMADDTRLSFRFSLVDATELGERINDLVRAFKTIKTAADDGKRVKEKSLEFRCERDGLKVEVECNPNVFPDAFTAKVYVVVDDGSIKVSSEALLTRVIDNVKAYKALMSA